MTTPKETMIKTLQAWMLGDYGHDLPAGHFEQEVDRLLAGLEEAGFVVAPRNPNGCDCYPWPDQCPYCGGQPGAPAPSQARGTDHE